MFFFNFQQLFFQLFNLTMQKIYFSLWYQHLWFIQLWCLVLDNLWMSFLLTWQLFIYNHSLGLWPWCTQVADWVWLSWTITWLFVTWHGIDVLNHSQFFTLYFFVVEGMFSMELITSFSLLLHRALSWAREEQSFVLTCFWNDAWPFGFLLIGFYRG